MGQSQRKPHGRVFGGQVLAQSVIAAGRTVDGVGHDGARPIHSLHGYFVRPGDDRHPIRFAVDRIRDGRSFSTRRVQAIQYGEPILSMIASFQEPAGGLDHQEQMPAAPDPEACRPADVSTSTTSSHEGTCGAPDRPAARRGPLLAPGRQLAARQSVWLSAVGTLPDDPLLHAAVLAYASDYSLLEPVLRRHGLAWSDPRLTSGEPRPRDVVPPGGPRRRVDPLHPVDPSAQGGRGLAFGRMFATDGGWWPPSPRRGWSGSRSRPPKPGRSWARLGVTSRQETDDSTGRG